MSIEPGQTIGDYEVMGRLGAGGIGEVYTVRHVISQRVEAMKLLRSDRTGGELPERFLREIRVLAMLSHQSIARLLTAFKVGNQIAMVMEYIEGQDLQSKLRSQWPGRAAEGTEYIRQILSALQYAHARDVVHRDIKPSNIMITSEGHAKLLDFGIAFKASDDSLTKPGSMVGSLHYMCPEQVRGEQVDPRSDLYSLGVTLYEIVTGRRPFDGSTEFEVMAAHLRDLPTWPGDVDPGIPFGLSKALMKALAKDPAERFQNAAEFLAALNELSRDDEATLHALSIKPAVHSLAPVPKGAGNTPVSHVKSNPSNTPVSHVKSTIAGGFAAPAGTGAQPSIDSAVLDSVVRELATFIGPIAKVVVKRAAAGCSSIDDLYSTVANEIESDKDRSRFLGTQKRRA